MTKLKICFISNTLDNQQVAGIYSALHDLSYHSGFTLVPYFHNGVEVKEKSLCDEIVSLNYDFIISLFPLNEENYLMFPPKTVLFIGNKEEYKSTAITLDVRRGMEEILDYYLQNQLFNIAFIGVSAGCNHCVEDHFNKHYINRLNIQDNRYFLTTCFGEVISTIESLREQGVDSIIFSSPRLLLRALKHERSSDLNLSKDFKVASLGWMHEFELFCGEIMGLSFNISEIREAIRKFINGNFDPHLDNKISPSIVKR